MPRPKKDNGSVGLEEIEARIERLKAQKELLEAAEFRRFKSAAEKAGVRLGKVTDEQLVAALKGLGDFRSGPTGPIGAGDTGATASERKAARHG